MRFFKQIIVLVVACFVSLCVSEISSRAAVDDFVVRTLPTMASLTGNDWGSSRLHFVLEGWHTAGDGAGGEFIPATCTPDGGRCVSDSAAHTFLRIDYGRNGFVDARWYGAWLDHVHDDGAAINSALAGAHAVGFGIVKACGNMIVTINIIIPAWTRLSLCSRGAAEVSTNDFTFATSGLTGIIAHPSTTVINMNADGAGIEDGTSERSDGTYSPATFIPHTIRDAAHVQVAHAGTDILSGGRANFVQNFTSLGFDTFINSSGKGYIWNNIGGDCKNCLIIDKSTAATKTMNVNFANLLTHGFNLQKLHIDNVFGDGLGHYKIVLEIDPTAFQFIDGDTIFISSAVNGGAQSIGGKWTIGCGGGGGNCTNLTNPTDGCVGSDSGGKCTEFTLNGSICAFASGTGCAPISRTGAVTKGRRADGYIIVQLASGDPSLISVGQVVTDTGSCLAGGTTVTQVWDSQNIVALSAPPICTSLSDILSFTDGNYSHDGRGAEFTTAQRFGTCLKVTNSGGVQFTHFVCYAHDIETECGENCNELRIENGSYGESDPLVDDDLTTILIDGDHDGQDGTGVEIVNSVLGQHVTKAIIVNSDSDRCSRFTSDGIAVGSGRKNGVMLEILAGCVVLNGSSSGGQGTIYVADNATFTNTFLDNNNTGDDYTVNDVLTVIDGSCSVFPQWTVSAVFAITGEIKDGKETRAGVCSSWGSNPLHVSGGTGHGAMLKIDGTIPAVLLATGNSTPKGDWIRKTVPGTALVGSQNVCLPNLFGSISPCNNTTDFNFKGFAPNTIVCSGGPGTAIGNTTSETIVASCKIPSGLMNLNSCAELKTDWDMTGSTNLKTMKAYVNTSIAIGGTAYLTAAVSANTAVAYSARNQICNLGALNSQRGSAIAGVTGSTTTGLPTSTIDTSQDWFLVITGTKATGSETLNLDHWQVVFQPF